LPEALARTNYDHKIVRRAPRGARRKPRNPPLVERVASGLLRQFWVRPGTTIAGASFAALMTGIALNALVLQKVRHPAPLFGSAAVHSPAAPAAETHPGTAPRIVTTAVPPPQPVARAADPTHDPAPADEAPPSAHDQIAALLNGETAPAPSAATHRPKPAPGDSIGHFLKTKGEDPAADTLGQFLKHDPGATSPDAAASDKMVLAAQRALAKLGYAVKPNGVFGQTTRQALEHFQKDHHLPVSDRVTPHLLRELTAAADNAAE
jgi:hypothetical protein